MERWQELEKAATDYLTIKNIPFIQVKHRCYKCGCILKHKSLGFPDVLIISPLTAVEVKTGKGKLTKEQKEFKELWQSQGLPYVLLRDTIDELLEYFEVREKLMDASIDAIFDTDKKEGFGIDYWVRKDKKDESTG